MILNVENLGNVTFEINYCYICCSEIIMKNENLQMKTWKILHLAASLQKSQRKEFNLSEVSKFLPISNYHESPNFLN